MGQHFVAQREGFSGAGFEVALTYHVERDSKSGVRGVVLVPRVWLEEGRVSPGVYLVSVTDGKRSIGFFAEYTGDTGGVSWWYRRVPRKFAGVFKDRSVVWLGLRRVDVSEFVELAGGRVVERVGGLDGLGVEGGRVVFEVSGRRLSFPVVEFGYQVQMRHTGAYVVFSRSGGVEDSLKILHPGCGDPGLYVWVSGNRYLLVEDVSCVRGALRVRYSHSRGRRVHEKVIDLAGSLVDPSVTRVKAPVDVIQEYYRAASFDDLHRMGAIGTRLVVDRLEGMGYKIMRADTVGGSMRGPDVVATAPEGNHVIVEVKSTSSLGRIDEVLSAAEKATTTKYFDPDHGFTWKRRGVAHYAPEGIAVAVHPDCERDEIIFYAKEFRFEVIEGEKRVVEKSFKL